MITTPDFMSQNFLKDHTKKIMDFYHPKCVDPEGGFFHAYTTNGEKITPEIKQLVSSARFVINYARMARINNDDSFLEQCRHGLEYIKSVHWSSEKNKYHWVIVHGNSVVPNDFFYGWAFVLLAYAEALQSGLSEYKNDLYMIYHAMNEKYWLPEYSLYADEYGADGQCDSYRGQNCNMHAVEASLSCYAATSDSQFLDRAYLVANRIINELPDPNKPLIWEHYNQNWEPDWEYNKDKPDDMLRPWGYQPGHLTEWAKFLLIMHQYKPESWMVERAEYLFTQGVSNGWDHEYGGLVYSFNHEGQPSCDQKFYWVQAESFAAAYLAAVTGKKYYLEEYQRIWAYAWEHLVDHEYGAWHHKLTREGELMSEVKSPLGKTDYHTLGACYDVLNALKLSEQMFKD